MVGQLVNLEVHRVVPKNSGRPTTHFSRHSRGLLRVKEPAKQIARVVQSP